MATANRNTAATVTPTNENPDTPTVVEPTNDNPTPDDNAAPEHRLVTAHKAAVIRYLTADSLVIPKAKRAGVKASATREINGLETDMVLAGVAFQPFARPNAVRKSFAAIDETETRQTVARYGELLRDRDVAENVKDELDRRVTKILAAAKDNGFNIADPRKSAPTPSTASVDAEVAD